MKLLIQTYNLHLFPPWLAQINDFFSNQTIQKDDEFRLVAVARALLQTNADCVLLTEIWHQPYAQKLLDLVSQNWPYSVYPTFRQFLRPLNSGLLFLSKIPISSYFFQPFENSFHPDSWATKGLLMVKLSNNIRLIGTHLQANYSNSDLQYFEMISRSQIHQLIDLVRKYQIDWVLGDFNVDPSSLNFQLLTGELQKENLNYQPTPPRTVPSLAYLFTPSIIFSQMDYIFAKRLNWSKIITNDISYQYIDAENQKHDASDHFPILSEVTISNSF